MKHKGTGGRAREHQRQRAVTSYDVAAEAGVSQSAVSRTFSNRGYVSEATRKRVMEAANKLGFHPNAIARSLITRQSKIVAVVMSELRYSFYVALLHELCHAVRSAGYQVLLTSIPEGEEVDDIMPDVLAYRAAGVIMTGVGLSSRATGVCREAGVPLVMVNRYVSDRSFCAVSADNEDGGRRVAQFLLAGGHQRLAFVAGLETASTSVDRERGFFDGAAEAGTRHPLRAKGHFTYDGGRAAAVELMRSASPPDAIFCASDIMAMGAMDALRYELGLRVPEDVSVVGFINAAESAWNSYRLTTVSVDVERMCRQSVAMLAELMEDPDLEPRRDLIKGELILRSSARLPRGFAHADMRTGPASEDPAGS